MQALVTDRLLLEPLRSAHADALYPHLADPRQLEFLDQAAPASPEALRQRFARLESRRSPDGRQSWLNWALFLRQDDARPIGVVQATVLEDGRAWVAYQLAHAHWGRGLAGEAVAAMIGHLTGQHRVMQCMATVDARNVRSWRLLERLGFACADAAHARAMQVAAGDLLYRFEPLR
jgi:[ribosomal protein S5]-alanine N-acetyltransferase